MAEIDIKLYTTRLKELEVAKYTQKNLMDSYEKNIEAQKPTPPRKKQYKAAC